MRPEEIEKSIKSLHNYDWSADSIFELTVDALDADSVDAALYKYCEDKGKNLDREKFLEVIEVTKNGVLTKGGALFLGSEDAIRKHLGSVEYRFTWRQGIELTKNEVWSGNIWNALSRMKRCFRQCQSEVSFEYNQKTYVVPNLDPIAFDEVVTNAMVHRDYEKEGLISIEYNDSQLVVSSPGSFYGGVNAQNIAKHQPRHRNKSLARILMAFGLVDRAGMGVFRMGVKSLVYGRSFPSFSEGSDGIAVSMSAEYIRSGIFVLTQRKKSLEISDLMILNLLYKRGSVKIIECIDFIEKSCDRPWEAIESCAERWGDFIELFCQETYVGLRVKKAAINFFALSHEMRVPKTSQKMLALFYYLKVQKYASSRDITPVLGYKHVPQTSRLLKRISWIHSTGKTAATVWHLNKEYLNI